MGFREKISRFMYGRYGLDNLGKLIIYTSLILFFISSLFKLKILELITLGFLSYGYFRVLSKNIAQRSHENNKYLYYKEKLIKKFYSLKSSFSTDCCRSKCNQYNGKINNAEYKIFKCPNCKQKLRVPKGKGKICISCKRCGNEFVKRT